MLTGCNQRGFPDRVAVEKVGFVSERVVPDCRRIAYDECLARLLLLSQASQDSSERAPISRGFCPRQAGC